MASFIHSSYPPQKHDHGRIFALREKIFVKL